MTSSCVLFEWESCIVWIVLAGSEGRRPSECAWVYSFVSNAFVSLSLLN